MRLTPPISLLVPMALLGMSAIDGAMAKCSDGLVNIVFNLGGGGYTNARWNKISASNWLTFGFGLAEKQIPMLDNTTHTINRAISALTSSNPPDWMLTFNEPDNVYGEPAGTMGVYPKKAAEIMNHVLKYRGNHTKFVAPVPAFEMSNWLPEFFGNCSCQDAFSAYNIHVYNKTADKAIQRIEAFNKKYNDKPLWITEIAPRQDHVCPNPIPWNNTIDFMHSIYKWGQRTEWVEKIFWNSANEISCNDTNVAASFLLDFNNNSTPLLNTFNTLTCT